MRATYEITASVPTATTWQWEHLPTFTLEARSKRDAVQKATRIVGDGRGVWITAKRASEDGE